MIRICTKFNRDPVKITKNSSSTNRFVAMRVSEVGSLVMEELKRARAARGKGWLAVKYSSCSSPDEKPRTTLLNCAKNTLTTNSHLAFER